MEILVDTHAWVEYFRGSPAGEMVRSYIESPLNRVFTAECSLAELWEWANKQGVDFESAQGVLLKLSALLPIERKDWITAAKEKHERRKVFSDFGLMDAVILSKQRQRSFKLLTGDPHFRGLKGVIFY